MLDPVHCDSENLGHETELICKKFEVRLSRDFLANLVESGHVDMESMAVFGFVLGSVVEGHVDSVLMR